MVGDIEGLRAQAQGQREHLQAAIHHEQEEGRRSARNDLPKWQRLIQKAMKRGYTSVAVVEHYPMQTLMVVLMCISTAVLPVAILAIIQDRALPSTFDIIGLVVLGGLPFCVHWYGRWRAQRGMSRIAFGESNGRSGYVAELQERLGKPFRVKTASRMKPFGPGEGPSSFTEGIEIDWS